MRGQLASETEPICECEAMNLAFKQGRIVLKPKWHGNHRQKLRSAGYRKRTQIVIKNTYLGPVFPIGILEKSVRVSRTNQYLSFNLQQTNKYFTAALPTPLKVDLGDRKQ